MAQSYNQVTLLGRVGKEPEIRSFQSGDRVANFSLATSESWKKDGEKKEKTTWHNIVVTNQGLVKVIESYVKKGDLLLIVGKLENRSYDKNGETRYVTEVCLRPYNGELTMLGGKSDPSQPQDHQAPLENEFDQDIPF